MVSLIRWSGVGSGLGMGMGDGYCRGKTSRGLEPGLCAESASLLYDTRSDMRRGRVYCGFVLLSS